MPLDTLAPSRAVQLEGIARAAGERAKLYFLGRDDLVIETKRSLTDLVSIADREVEELIRAALHEAFPDDGILGEEYGLETGTSGMTWVIDPIDGTAPFLNGLPGWCVSIGLMDAQGPILGAIYAPMMDEMFIGGKGLPTTLNGKPTRVTDRFDLRSGLLATGSNDRVSPERIGRWHRDMAQAEVAWVRYSTGALMLAYVAAGRVVGFGEPRMCLWDCLAAYALIEAAGGRIMPFGPDALLGKPFPVLGSTQKDYDQIAEICGFDDPAWVI